MPFHSIWPKHYIENHRNATKNLPNKMHIFFLYDNNVQYSDYSHDVIVQLQNIGDESVNIGDVGKSLDGSPAPCFSRRSISTCRKNTSTHRGNGIFSVTCRTPPYATNGFPPFDVAFWRWSAVAMSARFLAYP